MNLHANAALSWTGRRRLCELVVDEGWTVVAAAAASGVSVRCARKWIASYRLEGTAGPHDRSSAPRRVANRTADSRVAAIVKLRRLRFTAAEIAETLGMALSTVSGILARLGMGRLGRLGLEPPNRYQRSRPGELLHVDVKKLGPIDRPGHRVTGSRTSSLPLRECSGVSPEAVWVSHRSGCRNSSDDGEVAVGPPHCRLEASVAEPAKEVVDAVGKVDGRVERRRVRYGGLDQDDIAHDEARGRRRLASHLCREALRRRHLA